MGRQRGGVFVMGGGEGGRLRGGDRPTNKNYIKKRKNKEKESNRLVHDVLTAIIIYLLTSSIHSILTFITQ